MRPKSPSVGRPPTSQGPSQSDFGWLFRAIEDLTSVLSQYIANNHNSNINNNNNQSQTEVYANNTERFMMLNPPTFTGGPHPMVAERWVRKIEIFLK